VCLFLQSPLRLDNDLFDAEESEEDQDLDTGKHLLRRSK
jgi:hypothetical protein